MFRRLCLLALLAAGSMPADAAIFSSPRAASTVSGGLVLKDGSGQLRGVNAVSGASAGFVILIDSATVPADGALTGANLPVRCMPLAANTGLDLSYRASPVSFYRGITIVFSTTGCFTKTASATAFLAGDVE